MKIRRLLTTLLCALTFLITARAQVPQVLSYQGRVTVGGVNFPAAGGSTTGNFKFALVSGDGSTTYWSNDGATPPVQEVPLTVTNGLYSVPLGDTTLTNMNAIPASIFSNQGVFLRIWFNDGQHGSQQLSPDQRIASVGYAVVAGSALSVANGSIGAAQLAPGSVQGSNLAEGAVQSGNIAAGAVGAAQIASDVVTGGPGGNLAPATVSIQNLAVRSVNASAAAGSVAQVSIAGMNTSSTTPVSLAMLTLVTTGRPVWVCLMAGSGSTASTIGAYGGGTSNAGTVYGYFGIYRDNQQIANPMVSLYYSGGQYCGVTAPPGAVSFLDIPTAGSHTYAIRISAGAVSNATVSNAIFTAFEF